MNSSAEAAHNRVHPTLPDWVQAQISDLQSRLVERDSELVKRDAELKRRELKIQQLTLELAHHKRIRFGCKSEALTSEQRDLFMEASDEDGAQAAVDTRLARLSNLVNLYKVLGCGWTERTATAVQAAPAGAGAGS